MDTPSLSSESHETKKPDWKQWGGVGLIVLVIIISISIGLRQKSPSSEPEQQAATEDSGTTTPTSTEPVQKNTNAAVKKPVPAKSYADMLKEYKGRTIQINDNCQAYPAESTFKTGTAVMFDNRSKTEKHISLSGTKFTIPALSYITMKITSKTTPNIVWIDCEKQYKVGKILVQQ